MPTFGQQILEEIADSKDLKKDLKRVYVVFKNNDVPNYLAKVELYNTPSRKKCDLVFR